MSHKTAVLALQHKPAPPSVLKIREEWKSHISEWVIPREAGNGHLLPFYGGLMNGHGQPLKNSTQVKCNEGPQSSAQIWSSWRGREMGRGRATEQNDYISLCFDSYYNKKKNQTPHGSTHPPPPLPSARNLEFTNKWADICEATL